MGPVASPPASPLRSKESTGQMTARRTITGSHMKSSTNAPPAWPWQVLQSRPACKARRSLRMELVACSTAPGPGSATSARSHSRASPGCLQTLTQPRHPQGRRCSMRCSRSQTRPSASRPPRSRWTLRQHELRRRAEAAALNRMSWSCPHRCGKLEARFRRAGSATPRTPPRAHLPCRRGHEAVQGSSSRFSGASGDLDRSKLSGKKSSQRLATRSPLGTEVRGLCVYPSDSTVRRLR